MRTFQSSDAYVYNFTKYLLYGIPPTPVSPRNLWKIYSWTEVSGFLGNCLVYLIDVIDMYGLQRIYSCSVCCVLGLSFLSFLFPFIHVNRPGIWFGMKGKRGMSFSLQMIYFLCLGLKQIFLFSYYISFLELNPEVTAFPLVWFVVGLFSFQGLLSTASSSPVCTFPLDANPGVFLSF